MPPQNYARRNKLPIDTVGYDFVMMDMDPEKYTQPPAEGVYIHGLFLEGAGWDAQGKQLCESRPKVRRTASVVPFLCCSRCPRAVVTAWVPRAGNPDAHRGRDVSAWRSRTHACFLSRTCCRRFCLSRRP